MKQNHLIMFYGTDCPACMDMKILLDKLQKQWNINIETRDVWTGADKETNYRMFENYIEMTGNIGTDCDGLPFCINTETNQFLCGNVSYKKLEKWAMGNRMS